jgi:4-amino-4-deoxy-L-arabinose transferase-like glycosyltransferase
MFLFTAGFLALPFYLLISLVVWFKKKDQLRAIILILLSTAFLNALAHTMFSHLDRYFFFVYPLILLAFTIDIFGLFQYLKNKFGLPNRNQS